MMTIREAIEADAAAMGELAGELGYPCESLDLHGRLIRLLRRADHLLLVAISGERICGWLQAHSAEVLESGFRVEIVGLVVLSAVRRQGVGKLLVAQAECWASKIGAPLMIVRSNVQRKESHLFYPALGYDHSKTQAVYKKTIANSQKPQVS